MESDHTLRMLQEAGLRRTAPRQTVLEFLIERNRAVSQQEIEQALEGRVDRVTVYRMLAAFEENGLIHRILDTEGVAQFALCSEACDGHAHHHEHLHFHCTRCGHTYCLDMPPMAKVTLPKGYRMEEVDLHLKGRCPACS